MVPSLQRAVKGLANFLESCGHRCYLQRRGEGIRLTIKTPIGRAFIVTFYKLNDVELADTMFFLGLTAPTKT